MIPDMTGCRRVGCGAQTSRRKISQLPTIRIFLARLEQTLSALVRKIRPTNHTNSRQSRDGTTEFSIIAIPQGGSQPFLITRCFLATYLSR